MASFAKRTANLVLIQVYKPIIKHSDADMKEINEIIEEALKVMKTEDNVIIMGNWNAIV